MDDQRLRTDDQQERSESRAAMQEIKLQGSGSWSHADLVGSPHPRPYQYAAYAALREYGHQGRLVEAPTGSGKTMIGMMCIQDWLADLRSGQSILVLVPTSNCRQQWTGELCYQEIGLRLSPEMVFSGMPSQLERFVERTGSHPPVMLMTYSALSQVGSAVGEGGFDIDDIEIFLQGANVQYVVLDEVHKVAENLSSVSSDVTRHMMEWVHDGSLPGLIGFTGTGEAYRSRFAKLGLQLAYSIPIDELIATGFVAPFAELGVPFSYSARERRIRSLLDDYKRQMSIFMKLLGGERLRGWFAEIPIEERAAVGHGLLNMYGARKDWRETLESRLAGWEVGESLKLTETKLVSIVQIFREWSDADMARHAGVDEETFERVVTDLDNLRTQLAENIYQPTTLKRLNQAGFTTTFDVAAMRRAHEEATNQAARSRAVKSGLSTNIVGLYDTLSQWYRRVGEGRVESIKAIVEAERATRDVSGTIIVDNARRIDWRHGVATPGFEGIGGLFCQLLGDERFTPYAVLSSEQYLPYDEDDPLPPRISQFVETELMQGEIAKAMFDLVTQGLDVTDDTLEVLRLRWDALIFEYVPRLENIHAARPAEFSKHVLQPMRRRIGHLDLGPSGDRLLARIDLRNVHIDDLVRTFFDYALIARYFRQAKVAELVQVSGAHQKFFVIPMASGSRKLLMYELTSRVVDAESLPINMVVVSRWARTGWNVIAPNVLIDATATRDVTAWQQLRGRAIRARGTWTNDCYRLITAVIGGQMQGLMEHEYMPADVTVIVEMAELQQSEIELDEQLSLLLEDAIGEMLFRRIKSQGLESLTDDERTGVAISIMRHYNKVTYIFELVKAYGSTAQVEYSRPDRVWRRRPKIAAKHEHEMAVNPFDGVKSTGASHAPMVYAKDPRTDAPSELCEHLTNAIKDRDEVIVGGWFGRCV